MKTKALISNCTADLRLCFCIGKITVFSFNLNKYLNSGINVQLDQSLKDTISAATSPVEKS